MPEILNKTSESIDNNMAKYYSIHYVSSKATQTFFPQNTPSQFTCSINFPIETIHKKLGIRINKIIMSFVNIEKKQIKNACQVMLQQQSGGVTNKILCLFSIPQSKITTSIYDFYGEALVVPSFFLPLPPLHTPNANITFSFILQTLEGKVLELPDDYPTSICFEVKEITMNLKHEVSYTFSSKEKIFFRDGNAWNFYRNLPQVLYELPLQKYEVALQCISIPSIEFVDTIRLTINGNEITINLRRYTNWLGLFHALRSHVLRVSKNQIYLRALEDIATVNEEDPEKRRMKGFEIRLKKSTNKTYHIKLGQKLKSLLDFKDDEIILSSSKHVYRHELSDFTHETIREELAQQHPQDTPSVIALCCDLIKNVYAENVPIPIIQVVDLARAKTLYEPKQLIFHPCNPPQSTVHFKFISIHDKSNVPFKTTSPLFITLYFRLKK